MTYNLDENIAEYFEFIVGGNTYKMKYPTTDELEVIQKIKDQTKQGEAMLDFISVVTEGAPDILTAMKDKNVQVTKRFRDMIAAEIGMG